MKRAMDNERFAVARTDPSFRPMQRREAKVALDSRFTPMLGSSEAPVDKRGRRRKKGARENPMLNYYLNQEDVDQGEKKKKPIREEQEEEQDEEESSSSDDEEKDNDDQYSVGNDIAHYVMARHDHTPRIVRETRTLAVVHMDWDHIKAVDLYMVMSSCVPKDGQVLSVSVYPTKFGLKCMNIERTQGPSALIGADGDADADDGADDDGGEDSDLDTETEDNKLRTYGLDRLRYYCAVAVCDSSATAKDIYMSLEGTEFLETANVFDLHFIPDFKEFKYPPRDVATEAPPSYKKSYFDKISRLKFKDEFDDIASDDDDFIGKSLPVRFDDIASDDDDFIDESLPVRVAKRKLTYKEKLALLLPGTESEERSDDDQVIKITFNTELEDLERKSIERKTVWGMHQENVKEKREARKWWSKDDDGYGMEGSADGRSDEEAKQMKKQKVRAKGKGKDKHEKEHYEQEAELEFFVLVGQDAANGAKGYNIKRKSKKGKVSVEDKLAEIDLSKDERFSLMFTSHLYAVDPTHPQYKRSVRKQAGKCAHGGTLECEPPMEEPDKHFLRRRAIINDAPKICRCCLRSRRTYCVRKSKRRVKRTLVP